MFTGVSTNVVVNASSNTKCVPLSNQKSNIQPFLINLHPNEYSQELHYSPYAVKLDVLGVLILLMTHLVKCVFQANQKI